MGTYNELMERNQAFAEFLRNYRKSEESSESEDEQVEDGNFRKFQFF